MLDQSQPDQDSISGKGNNFLPTVLVVVTIALIVAKLFLYSSMGSGTEVAVGYAVGHILGAFFWPWLIWLIFRAIQGRDRAPNLQHFVLVGALILMPLLLLGDVVKYLSQPPLEKRAQMEAFEGCRSGFSKYSQAAIDVAERDAFCSCYSENLIGSLTTEELDTLKAIEQPDSLMLERIIQAGSHCGAAPIFARAIEEGISMIDAESTREDVFFTYQVDGYITAAELDNEIRDSIIAGSVKLYCDDPSLQVMLGYGVEISVRYINANSQQLFDYAINYNQCE